MSKKIEIKETKKSKNDLRLSKDELLTGAKIAKIKLITLLQMSGVALAVFVIIGLIGSFL